MNIEINDLVEAVDELNDLLPITSEQFFTIEYSSYWVAVSFGDIQLWCSENDDREFDEDKNEYEPFMPYLKKQLNNKIEELNYLNSYIQ
jgi:hypothetical protein